MGPPEPRLKSLLGQTLAVGHAGEMHVEGALGEVAPLDHILDPGEQERRAGDDQAFVGVGEQFAPALARTFGHDANGVGQPVGEAGQVVVSDDEGMSGGDEDVMRILRLRPKR